MMRRLLSLMSLSLVAALIGCGAPAAPVPTERPRAIARPSATPASPSATPVVAPTSPPEDAAALPEADPVLLALSDAASDAPGAESALAWFAAVFGPLPGVPAPAALNAPVSGTGALAAVFAAWDELDDAQRAAVRAALLLPADYAPQVAVPGTTGTIMQPVPADTVDPIVVELLGAAGGGGWARPARELAQEQAYRDSLERAAGILRSHLGPLGRTVVLQIVARPEAGTTRSALASALVMRDGTCRIHAYRNNFAPPAANDINTLAHELTHCYQQVWNGGVLPRALRWVEEGGAEWAGSMAQIEASGQPDRTSVGFLGSWVVRAERSLFRRSYDAWGWLALADLQSPGMWGRVRAFSVAPDSASAYRAAAGSDPAAPWLARWATSQSWYPELGARWHLDAPGIPSLAARRPTFQALGNGARIALTAPDHASTHAAIDASAEVVRFDAGSAAGVVRLDATDRDIAELAGQAWCTRADDAACTCPRDTARAGERIPRLGANRVVVALAGGAAAVAASVSGRSLRDECGSVARCPVGRWAQAAPGPFPDGVRLIAGGTGAELQIAADGTVIQDFSAYAPIIAEAGDTPADTVRIGLSPQGQITSRIVIPADGPFTESPVTGVDASGLAGDGYIEVGGQRSPVTTQDLISIVSGLLVSPALGAPDRQVVLRCDGADTVLLDAGWGQQVYTRVP